MRRFNNMVEALVMDFGIGINIFPLTIANGVCLNLWPVLQIRRNFHYIDGQTTVHTRIGRSNAGLSWVHVENDSPPL